MFDAYLYSSRADSMPTSQRENALPVLAVICRWGINAEKWVLNVPDWWVLSSFPVTFGTAWVFQLLFRDRYSFGVMPPKGIRRRPGQELAERPTSAK